MEGKWYTVHYTVLLKNLNSLHSLHFPQFFLSVHAAVSKLYQFCQLLALYGLIAPEDLFSIYWCCCQSFAVEFFFAVYLLTFKWVSWHQKYCEPTVGWDDLRTKTGHMRGKVFFCSPPRPKDSLHYLYSVYKQWGLPPLRPHCGEVPGRDSNPGRTI